MSTSAECCWHSAGPVPDDVECCLCTGHSCGRRTGSEVLAHERRQRESERAAWDRQLAYVLLHGHDQADPWADEPCPSSCRAEAQRGVA